MAAAGPVVIVTDDLMFETRLRAALGIGGPPVATARGGDGVPEAATVFVDLNSRVESRLELISELRRSRPGATIVGFCHHGEDRVRISAMASGASQVVTNGAVPAVARRLLEAG